jgi:DNA-binding LytR/AlgR family response regulator
MKIKCVLIDDEPLAQRVIEKYAQDVPGLEIAGKFSQALEATDILRNEKIDLIFLDINMPKISGIDFLKTMKNPPHVIITTAYAEYALEGYELNVVDYLMKPFGFDRFLKAVHKVMDVIQAKELSETEPVYLEKFEDQIIFVKSGKKTYKVKLTDILYIEALGDYIKVYTTDRMIISYQSMKNVEKLLPSSLYPRVHKSYIISLAKIDMIEGNQIRIKDKLVPIGTNYKNDFEKLIRMG